MNPRYWLRIVFTIVVACVTHAGAEPGLTPARPNPARFEPFIWPSDPPPGCPFPASKDLSAVLFTGVHREYSDAESWFPTWAADGNLYTTWTDGVVGTDRSDSSDGPVHSSERRAARARRRATTGQAVWVGDDPLSLEVRSLGVIAASGFPYGGRYPCGSLYHKGTWYYGTYCCGPERVVRFGESSYRWPWLGPFVGFRISRDSGETWAETPHSPEEPLFAESGRWGYPVKIGAPHFVDFGRELEHSPDGCAYLVAQGAVEPDREPQFGNLGWMTADHVYLLRTRPSPETINDPHAYEFFAGFDVRGEAVWTSDFQKIRPLLEWNNRLGCVTATYLPPLRKFLLAVTDGGSTSGRMDTLLLEADRLTGPWRLVSYLRHFGEQAYFVNFPSKFVSADGRTLWMAYSANAAPAANGVSVEARPPGSRRGLVLQQVQLLDPEVRAFLAPCASLMPAVGQVSDLPVTGVSDSESPESKEPSTIHLHCAAAG